MCAKEDRESRRVIDELCIYIVTSTRVSTLCWVDRADLKELNGCHMKEANKQRTVHNTTATTCERTERKGKFARRRNRTKELMPSRVYWCVHTGGLFVRVCVCVCALKNQRLADGNIIEVGVAVFVFLFVQCFFISKWGHFSACFFIFSAPLGPLAPLGPRHPGTP